MHSLLRSSPGSILWHDIIVATLLRYLPTYTSLATLGVVDYSYPAGDAINGHTATELLNNLAPALRLDRFVVDFTYAQYDSRQNILESVAAVSKIMQDPPESLCCLEIRVTDWDGTASWWKAEIVSLFFAAVRACGMLQVIVIRPHAERERTALSLSIRLHVVLIH